MSTFLYSSNACRSGVPNTPVLDLPFAQIPERFLSLARKVEPYEREHFQA